MRGFPERDEDWVVAAAARAITGPGPLELLARPDEVVRGEKAIDYLLRGAGGPVHVEHTLLNALDEEPGLNKQIEHHLRQPLLVAIGGRLRAGGSVLVDVPVWKGMRYGPSHIDAMADLVVDAVAQEGFDGDTQSLVMDGPCRPLDVFLYPFLVQPSSGQRVFVRGYLRTEKQGRELLAKEVARALREKAPKLEATRRAHDGGSVPTLLVLEHRRPLTDPNSLRALLLEQALQLRVPLPDFVAAVEVVQRPAPGVRPSVGYLHAHHPDVPLFWPDDFTSPHHWVALFDLRDHASAG